MIILNYSQLLSEKFNSITSIEDIKNTEPNSIVSFKFSKEIAKYCEVEDIEFAPKIESLKEAIFSNSLGAKYLLLESETLALRVQRVAENYIFDSKVILSIDSEDEIEKVAELGIDGVFLRSKS